METVKTPKIIKRYSNRKLYDTSQSSYITLDDIAQFVQEGEDITVIDNQSGKDITSQTLTQIIFENEKKSKKTIPTTILKDVIQTKGGSITAFLQKTLIDPVTQVGTEAGHVIKDVAYGIEDWQRKIDKHIRATVQEVTGIRQLRKKIGLLNKKLRYLEKKVEEYERHPN
ncbi:MAG: polyhydroxyalkanoate synthesis regulator DNA-binding domain-containing protein [Deltaproteobacteria bacterium]|nr:polyhydroxyalkanoate synthesis regulator DNA-binding domain-containing protein [Deltaproteobacteria bacterium]